VALVHVWPALESSLRAGNGAKMTFHTVRYRASTQGDHLKQLNEVLMEKNELLSQNNLMTNQITKLSEDLAQKFVCASAHSGACIVGH
jgi:hypothetical protein